MDQFELLMLVVSQIIDEKVKVCKVILTNYIAGFVGVDVGQQLDVVLQKGLQQLQLQARQAR